MFSSVLSINLINKSVLLLLSAAIILSFAVDSYSASSSKNKLGVIKGVVRDKAGKPIDKATIAVFPRRHFETFKTSYFWFRRKFFDQELFPELIQFLLLLKVLIRCRIRKLK